MRKTHFDRIYLKFGNGCNFDCKYCSQGESDRFFQNKPVIGCTLSEEVIDYLDYYVQHLNNPDSPTYIVLWGGEPLLYFDSIKFVVERYGNAFKYGTATNGSYLSQEIVDFFNKHEIRLALSHDGSITEETRGIDVLKNKRIRDLYGQVDKSVFFSVITAKNSTYTDIYDYFNDLGFPEMNVDCFLCLDTNGKDVVERLTDFDYDKFDTGFKELFKRNDEFLNGKTEYHREHRLVQGAIQTIQKRILNPIKKGKFFCETCGVASQGTKINIMWNGKVTACHNSNVVIGHISNDYEKIKNNRQIYEAGHSLKVDCTQCEFEPICQGVCSHTTDKGAETWCKLNQIILSNTLLYIKEKTYGK